MVFRVHVSMLKPNTKLSFILIVIFFISSIAILYQIQLAKLHDKLLKLEQLQEKYESLKNKKEEISSENNIIVLYNRVPKTASTSFVGVAYDLCKRNNFHVLHVNITANSHTLSLENQRKFAVNVSDWDSMKPALYHGHFAYVDFVKKPGNKWALNEAKKNLINNYFLVGLTEELGDFISVLEQSLPRLFKGASDHYLNSNKSHLRQTVQKDVPSEETVKKIKESVIWQMENELYEFAYEHFHFIKKFGVKNKLQNVMYEKIRPKG